MTLDSSAVVAMLLGEEGHQRLAENGAFIVPFDSRHRVAAAQAFARYGRGRHPARLNYGDCMTYAAAKVGGHPLLFTGEDFAQTDIPAALG